MSERVPVCGDNLKDEASCFLPPISVALYHIHYQRQLCNVFKSSIFKVFIQSHQRREMNAEKLEDWELEMWDEELCCDLSQSSGVGANAKRALVGAGARALFYPTLLYNVVRNKIQPEFHWWDRVDEFILLGAVPFAADVPCLKKLGVGGVVTLNESYETLVPTLLYHAHSIDHLVIPTRDYLFAPSLNDTCRAVDFIYSNASLGRMTYVHCKAGRGRSTTIVLCYLVEHKQMTPDAAYNYVKSIRPRVVLASAQWKVPFEPVGAKYGIHNPANNIIHLQSMPGTVSSSSSSSSWQLIVYCQIPLMFSNWDHSHSCAKGGLSLGSMEESIDAKYGIHNPANNIIHLQSMPGTVSSSSSSWQLMVYCQIPLMFSNWDHSHSCATLNCNSIRCNPNWGNFFFLSSLLVDYKMQAVQDYYLQKVKKTKSSGCINNRVRKSPFFPSKQYGVAFDDDSIDIVTESDLDGYESYGTSCDSIIMVTQSELDGYDSSWQETARKKLGSSVAEIEDASFKKTNKQLVASTMVSELWLLNPLKGRAVGSMVPPKVKVVPPSLRPYLQQKSPFMDNIGVVE
ncbi:putative dual specificity protein phosphatase DSP8 [Vitis vinifera]|uniref:phosphatidylglycerophosphatase n=1 Tax=Vitis vinifera TaxID=29760 RepID=A0A438HJ47_VITVI|nr:putative dual specificity protein phosphatase DSP8 [Vitis vinifera]